MGSEVWLISVLIGARDVGDSQCPSRRESVRLCYAKYLKPSTL